MKAIHRVIQYIEYKGLNNSSFEKKYSLSNGYLATQLKRNADLGEGILNKILNNSQGLNPEWLLTGNGEMIRDIVASSKATGVNGQKLIPLVNISAVAGFGNGNFSISESDVKDYYIVPKFKDRRIDFMIEVSGSSMYPKYASGDIIACTIIKESRFIQWGKAHVIGTQEQGILVKRLFECTDKKKNCIECHSDNPKYPAFDLPHDDITGIALVVGVIRLE